ncbi:hypothetical protein [Oryza sativa Japonica Group]|uniref:Uncharacterized protein n=1 Tax=Oryza sativa subsp. japonica TaxID=39947 RepID=Q5Z832_ORYSJ|nr:hypothetical protein [Oryza sativa Japonica Group]BAD54029.1 hypothetical protein [Oryza sativa Japonica Group]
MASPVLQNYASPAHALYLHHEDELLGCKTTARDFLRQNTAVNKPSSSELVCPSSSSIQARAELEPSLLHLRAFRQARFELGYRARS